MSTTAGFLMAAVLFALAVGLGVESTWVTFIPTALTLLAFAWACALGAFYIMVRFDEWI